MADTSVAFPDSPPLPTFPDSPPLPQDNRIMDKVKEADPEAPDKLALAGQVNKTFGLPHHFTVMNAEAMSGALYGAGTKIKEAWQKLMKTNDAVVKTRERNKLASNIISKGTATPDQIAELQKRTKEMPAAKEIYDGLPKQSLDFFYTMAKAGRLGLAGGGAAFLTAEAVGQGMTAAAGPGVPLAELSTQVSSVSSFLSFFGVGMASEIAVDSAEQARGQAFTDIISMKDPQGRMMDPSVAARAANGIGAVTGVLMAATTALGPTMQGIAKQGIQRGLVSIMMDGSLQKTIAGILGRTAVASGEMAAQSVAQESANLLFERAAKEVNNRVNGTSFTQAQADEVIKRLKTAFASGAVQGVLLHGGEAASEVAGMRGAWHEAAKAMGSEAPAIETEPAPEGTAIDRPPARAMPGRTVGQVLDEIAKSPGRIPESLDVSTRSAEGSADYVLPSVEELQSRIAELPAEVRGKAKENASVAGMIRDIGSIDTKTLPTQAVVTELSQAVKENEGKPLFYDYTERLRAAQAKVGLRDTIEAVRDRFSLVKHTPGKLVELNALADKLASGEVPMDVREEDIARLRDLGKRPLRDLAVSDLGIVHDLITRAKKAADDLGTAVINGVRQDMDIARRTLTAEMPARLRDETFFRKTKSALEHYQTLVSEIFGGERSSGYKLLAGDLDSEEPWSSRRDQWSPLQDFMKGHGGNWFYGKMKVPGLDHELTRDQVMAINGILSQENGKESLQTKMGLGSKLADKIVGASDEFFSNVQAAMDPEMKKWLSLVYQHGESMRPELTKAAIRMNDMSPTMVEGNYYPFHRMMGSSLEEDMVSGKLAENKRFLPGDFDPRTGNVRASVNKGHMIPRVDSKAGLWIRGTLSDLHDSIDFSADYIHLAEKVRNAAKILWDPTFSREIENRFGTFSLKALRKGLLAMSGQRDPMHWPEKLLLDLRRKGITGVLGWNIPNAALNRTLMMRAMALGVPVKDMAKATAQMIADPAGTRKWWHDHSGLAYSILTQGLLPEMGEAKPGGRIIKKISEVSMAPEKWGFGGAAINEMQGSFNQASREMREGKLGEDVKTATGLDDSSIPRDDAAREKAAIQYAEWVTKHTHAVPREMYQTNLSREGIIGKLATTLYSERSALLNMGMRILNGNSPRKAGAFMRYIAVGVLGEAASIAGIRYLADKGKEVLSQEITGKKDRGKGKPQTFLTHAFEELGNQFAGLVPVAGQVEYAVQSALTGGRTAPSGDVFAPDFTGSAFRIVQGVKQYVSTRSEKKKHLAALRTINEFLSITLPYGAGIAYSHSLRQVVQWLERSAK